MARQRLTDRTLQSLKPAKPGERYEILDALVPGLAIRVTDKGFKSFVLKTRFPGSKNPTRRTLGQYGALTLDQARKEAREWLMLLRQGIDPAHAAADAKREAERKAAHTFESVADAFIEHMERNRQRRAGAVARELRKEFISQWGKRPIASITADDVTEVIDAAVARGAMAQAHNLLGHVRRLFNWAIARRRYGIDRSPCDRMRPADLIGPRALRMRILTDDELRAFWRATASLSYPWAPLFRALLLTAQRKSEIAKARRSALDLEQGLLTIPAHNMKSNRAQVVPLAPMAVEIFASLPEFTTGDCLFSATFGVKPVIGFSKIKKVLDVRMLDELRKMAADRGEDPDKVTLEPFVLHDLRRTARTHLSALPVPDLVRELCIGHSKPGLHKVYDQWAYTKEKREAFDLLATRLRAIVETPPANVIPIAGAAG